MEAYLGALADQPTHMVCGWVLPFRVYVLIQVVNNVGICVDDLFHVLRTHSVLHPGACTSYKALCIELIGVQKVST